MFRLLLTVCLALHRRLPWLAAALVVGIALLPGTGRADDGDDRWIDHGAQARFAEAGRPMSLRSNDLKADVDAAPPTIEYYTDDTYKTRARSGGLRRRLFLQAIARVCGGYDGVRRSVDIKLTSERRHRTEKVVAWETQAGSGHFRASVETGDGTGSVPTAPDDVLWATLEGCGKTVQTAVLIDPTGVVFDSASNQPVANAAVTLIDVDGITNGGRLDAPASVFDIDGVTPLPSTVTTGADGVYSFPHVTPGRYRLVVKPSSGHSFPSELAAAQAPQGRAVVAEASYGGIFSISAANDTVTVDVPVDSQSRSLLLQLGTSRTQAEIAESVVYLANVKNAGQATLDDVHVTGRLPAGFAYVPGSLRIDGKPAADPKGGRGPALDITVGTIAGGESRSLSYRALLGAGALQGDGVHRAQARATLPAATSSNIASVKVEVQGGVFTDKAMVLGTVFADCNRNGVQDDGEPGAAGVRLYLEDGTFVVTDALGHYSLYGLTPRTHVLKIDATSLPAGAAMAAISQRHAGDGASRFVDPRRGEMHRADFAIDGCDAGVTEALAVRAAALGNQRELDGSLKAEMTPDGLPRAIGDVRALQASGLIAKPEFAPGMPRSAAAPVAAASAASAASAAAPDATATPVVDVSLEQLASQLDPALDFLDLQDGQTVPAAPLLLRVKGHAGAAIVLTVNDEPVPDSRIGEKTRLDSRQIELREYVGIVLRPGRNVLTLTEQDGFGNVRGRRSVTVAAPGLLATLRVTGPSAPVPADGMSLVPVTIELLDAEGLVIGGRRAITLDATLGRWDVADLDPVEPGVQTFIDGGRATLGLQAAAQAGDADLRVAAGAVHGEARVQFVPALRPLLAVGVVEGVLNLRKLSSDAVRATSSADAFEQELRGFADGSDERSGTRAAMFLKGKVRGDTLLTLAYDSDKDTHERLFRDIQPDAFYPIYGDSSVKGYDAQSTSKLYVRVEQGKSWLLLGDFTTQSTNPARQLGAYQRSLTGIRQHVETERVEANFFASRDSTRQTVVELPGNGTSGPYALGSGDALVNSEKVEIVVRDRNQPSLILSSTPQQRFTDYEFEAFTGSLLFRAPVPSVDANLNPISVRITYEVEQGGPKFWVAGGDAQVKLTETISVGGSAVRDWNPLQPFELGSVNAVAQLGPQTVLIAEAARTRQDGDAFAPTTDPAIERPDAGNAERIELQHSGESLKARVYAGRSDLGFANPSSTLGSGRSEAGLKASYAIDPRMLATAEALHTGDIATGATRDGALLGIERSFDGGVKAELGLRRVIGTAAATATVPPSDATIDTTSVRAKLGSTLPWLPQASAYVEAEQDVREHDRRVFALGGDYQLAGRGRIYARHEFVSSLSGPYALDSTQRRNTSLLGIDAQAGADGRAFSEYRARNAIDGREAEAAIGLRNLWTLAEGLRLNTSVERVQALSGSDENQSAAVTGAVEYTANPLWKGTARLELRHGASSDSLLSTLGVAWKLERDWSLLAKNVFALTRYDADQPMRRQERFQIGAAYRDGATNRINALARYEFKSESGQAPGVVASDGRRDAHIVSTHADYHPSKNWTWTGQLAAKRVDETIDGQRVLSSAQLVSARAMRDLGDRWDVGVGASVLASRGFASRQTSFGAEAGYRIADNTWASLGYNLSGFKDQDLSADNYTERGIYVRLRFNFDESLFGASKG